MRKMRMTSKIANRFYFAFCLAALLGQASITRASGTRFSTVKYICVDPSSNSPKPIEMFIEGLVYYNENRFGFIPGSPGTDVLPTRIVFGSEKLTAVSLPEVHHSMGGFVQFVEQGPIGERKTSISVDAFDMLNRKQTTLTYDDRSLVKRTYTCEVASK